jgi:hypothetical protein
MAKPKRKPTVAKKSEKAQFMTIFISEKKARTSSGSDQRP